MLKKTETEETTCVFIFTIGSILIWGAGALGPFGYAYGFMITGQVCSHINYKIWHNQTAKKYL